MRPTNDLIFSINKDGFKLSLQVQLLILISVPQCSLSNKKATCNSNAISNSCICFGFILFFLIKILKDKIYFNSIGFVSCQLHLIYRFQEKVIFSLDVAFYPLWKTNYYSHLTLFYASRKGTHFKKFKTISFANGFPSLVGLV